MTSPISLASGLGALVVFAFQSSNVLYHTVAGFHNNQRDVRELKEELRALEVALKSLQENVSLMGARLDSLKLPLLRCGKACQDFDAVIVKCTTHSGGSRTSFKDWAKLKYMDDDLVGFKTMIAGYKATISIALCDANIRTSIITAAVFKDYKELIANTTTDLKEHLHKIDSKLQSLSLQDGRTSGGVTAERQRMQEERDSTQQCLGICAEASARLDQVQPNVFQDIATPALTYDGAAIAVPADGLPRARVVGVEAFKACKETLTNTTSGLEKHLQDISARLQKLTPHQPSPPRTTKTGAAPASTAQATAAERKTIQEEMDSIRECLAICSKAAQQADQERANFYEEVSMASDGSQLIVSTTGDLIFARRVTVGPKSMQLLGQMSDDTIQKLSRNHSYALGAKKAAVGAMTARPAGPEPVRTGRGGAVREFENRYGVGNRLSAQTVEDVVAK